MSYELLKIPFQLEILASLMRQGREWKIKNWKGRYKMVIICRWYHCIENSKKSAEKLLV